MNVLGVLMAVVIASAPTPTSADWSITPVYGPAVSAPGTSSNPELMPGQASTSGYLITHTDAIDGPLDVSATSTDAASDFENHLRVTVAVNGGTGHTQTLANLLWHSGTLRATNALPSGPVMLTVTIKFDSNAGPTERLRSIDFTLLATVSNEVVALPGRPGDPGAGHKPLAPTGQALSIGALVLGGSLTGFGVLLVVRRRRTKPVPTNVQPTG